MKNFIKYIFVATIMVIHVSSAFAKSVKYTYKPFSEEGCEMEYSVVNQDTSYFIIATVMSDRMYFLDNPTMKVRTFDNYVITLHGKVIGNTTETSNGYVIGNAVNSTPIVKSTAQFPITPDVLELFKNGVYKVRLSMRPMSHERCFKRDEIGKSLYQLYLEEKYSEENF
ncbi:MAG: hypothetical protein MJZ19_06100 [Paludibacteraceae bacterium]|nr:hypothetical protein [Paludibacteraceae bacterium]